MERQDEYIRSDVGTIVDVGATYVCDCGRMWRWERRTPGLRPLFDEEDFIPPWVEEHDE